MMSKQEAMAQATDRALAALAGVDLPARLPRLGLPAPAAGVLAFRLFGQDAVLRLADLDLRTVAPAATARPADRLLVLHYLRHEGNVQTADRLVPFREFPGGAFYEGPFRTRTVAPLVARFGNDLDELRGRLRRFDSTPVAMGDLGARIHAFGPLHLTLVYQRGDEELGPSAEVLFAAAVRRVFGAEDAAVLASRICLGLL